MTKVMHVRVGDHLSQEISKVVEKGDYVSPSDFVREALRKALDEINRRESLYLLEKNFGRVKKLGIKEPTNEDLEKIRRSL